MELSIRAVQEEDAASIVDVLNPIIRAGTHSVMDSLLSANDQLAFIREFPQRGVFHVAVRNDTGRVVGLQDVVPVRAGTGDPAHEGEITTFVALDAQRQGIGRRLCEATFPAARELGFTKLRAAIRADNPRALAFYVSQGFRVVGTAPLPALVRDEPVTLVLAERITD